MLQLDDGEATDSAGEQATTAGTGDEDPPRRRRRGRGRSSESAAADESANEILRAAYRRELDDRNAIPKTSWLAMGSS